MEKARINLEIMEIYTNITDIPRIMKEFRDVSGVPDNSKLDHSLIFTVEVTE